MQSAMQRSETIRRPSNEWTAVTDRESDHLRLIVRTTGGVALLGVHDIDYLEADGNVVNVHAGSHVHRLRLPLSVLLERLVGFGFLRIHRGTVVRAASIKAIEKGRYRKAVALMRNGARLEIGRAEFNRLRALWQPGLLNLRELTETLHLLDEVLAG